MHKKSQEDAKSKGKNYFNLPKPGKLHGCCKQQALAIKIVIFEEKHFSKFISHSHFESFCVL